MGEVMKPADDPAEARRPLCATVTVWLTARSADPFYVACAYASAAHGLEENVLQLLSSGRVAAVLGLDISRAELTAQVQGLIKKTLSGLLGSIREDDIAIVSVEDGMSDALGPGAAGVAGGECINMAFSVAAAAGGQGSPAESGINMAFSVAAAVSVDPESIAKKMRSVDAESIAKKMRDASFTLRVDALLEEQIRTVQWNTRWEKPPAVIKYGVNDRDAIGCTALHWAALNDRVSLMKLLIQNGAELTVPGNDGHTAMHWAALKGHIAAVTLLARADVNARDNWKFTAWEGTRADVNARDNWKFTAVTRAAQNGHLLVVLGLLQAGADPSLCDDEKHNALHWAVYHRQILEIWPSAPDSAR
ncbi:ankyrin repeat-containing domain protein [Baffinella frigidus]|nr:ankyrin repeat-containing domain protein [Cryptophyta sp. CCMP2293]